MMMSSLTKSLVTAVRLAFTDRQRFKSGVYDKIALYRNRDVVPQDQRTVSQELPEVLQVISAKKHSKVFIFANAGFRNEVIAQNPAAKDWKWFSSFATDLSQGARQLFELMQDPPDAVLVGGAESKHLYVQALCALKSAKHNLPVYWVGKDYEFGGSTVALAGDVDDAEFFLYNHYEDFFLSKDPLLVSVRVRDTKSTVEMFRILSPHETLVLKLSEILPSRSGTTVIEFSTTHPVLTRRRHRRWRVWADVYWKGSFTSLHGAHDYGPAWMQSSVTSPHMINQGRMVVTFPNYQLDMNPEERPVTLLTPSGKVEHTRNPEAAVEEIVMQLNSAMMMKTPWLGFRHRGYGDHFFYFLEDQGFSGGQRPVILGNHKASQPLELQTAAWDEGSSSAWIASMRKQGFAILPHALPVLKSSDEHEFGFSFDWVNPPVTKFLIHVFAKNSEKIGEFPYEKTKTGPVFTSEVLAGFADRDRANMLVMEIDLSDGKVDPRKIVMAGDLVVQNKKTGDRDFTEYQSCWRNVGVLFRDFPHWIHPSKNLVSRSNLVGRALNKNGMQTAVLLVNGSGNLNYKTTAKAVITIYDQDGNGESKSVQIPPFDFKAVWLHELFPHINEVLKKGHGSVTIQSSEADLNAQIYTASESGSVSLQHLWGY